MLTTLRKYILLLFVSLVPLAGFSQYSDSLNRKSPAETQLEQLLFKLKQADPAIAAKLPVYFNLVDDIQRALSQYQDFQQKDSLSRAISDTLSFRKTLNSLDSAYRLLAPLIRTRMGKIELELYEDAAEKIALSDTVQAVALLERALQYKPAFHPAWYELIRLHLFPEKAEKAMEYFTNAQTRMDTLADPYYARLYRETAPRVLDVCTAKAMQLTLAENYLASLKLLEKTEHFAILHKIPQGKEKVAIARNAARQGIYDSFVRIASRAREARKWQLSADYYKKAMDYQEQYPGEIIQTSTYDPTPVAVVEKEKPAQTTRHKSRHAKKKHRKERQAHVSVLPIQQTDTVKKVIREIKAVRKTTKIPKTTVVADAIPVVDSVFITAQANAREQILRSTYDSYFIVWKNQLDSAAKILAINLSRQKEYKLDNDSNITASLEELRRRIEDKQCFNLRSEYDNSLNRAINYCKRAEFVFAQDQLQRAENILLERNNCKWNDSLFLATKKTYGPAIDWNQRKTAYEAALQQGNYAEFQFLFEESVKLFENNKLENLNLRQATIAEFLIQQNDPQLIADLSLYLVENAQPEKGLMLMNLLKDELKLKPGFKVHQQSMGRVLAKTYPLRGQKPAWLTKFLHDPWFKSMTKSYLRGCKRLPLPFLYL